MWFQAKHESTIYFPSGVVMEMVRNEEPEFKRIYLYKIDPRCLAKLTARTSLGSRRYDGELTQPNGRRILFDPEAIADKILDPVLVPLVEKFCNEALFQDGTFMGSKPQEFIDNRGVCWVRSAEKQA
jgi:hypothetical protein